MNTIRLIKFFACVVFAALALNSSAQVAKQPTESVQAVTTYIEISQVPAIIMETYNEDFPITTNETWHGYPI